MFKENLIPKMKKVLALAGFLALAITPKASLTDHLDPKAIEIRPRGNLRHAYLDSANLAGANLFRANLRSAN